MIRLDNIQWWAGRGCCCRVVLRTKQASGHPLGGRGLLCRGTVISYKKKEKNLTSKP